MNGPFAMEAAHGPGQPSPSFELDAVVVGAGVVGLAVARALALAGREVTVLESETAIGTHTSSRNSEVIHAGIYYEPGSWKARLCVRGKQLLYAYCAERGVAHRRLGKVIVATSSAQVATLEKYQALAARNVVGDLEWLDAGGVRALEPEVRAAAGLLSPSTGIIDSHAFMTALRRDAEAAGAHVVLAAPLMRGEVSVQGGFVLEVGGAEPARARCRTLVNAAGLFASRVALSLAGVPPASVPPCHYAIGHYFVLAGRSPFSRLVYPIPEPGGLGVHVTLDLGGQARFGPDVTWIDDVDYRFDETRAPAFYRAIRAYWPALPDGALQPGYTGIRPKLAPAGAPAQDFLIQGPEAHGVAGLVNLYGIESPGLTAALAIAEEVASLAGARS